MSYVKNLVSYLRHNEPAVALGAVASVAVAAQSAVAGAHSWKEALPLLVSLIIRRYVSPA